MRRKLSRPISELTVNVTRIGRHGLYPPKGTKSTSESLTRQVGVFIHCPGVVALRVSSGVVIGGFRMWLS